MQAGLAFREMQTFHTVESALDLLGYFRYQSLMTPDTLMIASSPLYISTILFSAELRKVPTGNL